MMRRRSRLGMEEKEEEEEEEEGGSAFRCFVKSPEENL